MKIFHIMDEESKSLVGVLFYEEKEKNCHIELSEYLDEWTAPLLFTGYIKQKIYSIPQNLSLGWMEERVIPSGRQNLQSILEHHRMDVYDEMKFLEISEGRCSQDSLYIKETNAVPDFVKRRL